jgi:hypothetical protein
MSHYLRACGRQRIASAGRITTMISKKAGWLFGSVYQGRAWEFRSHGLVFSHRKLLIPLRAVDTWNAGSEPKLFHPRQNLGKGKKGLKRGSP